MTYADFKDLPKATTSDKLLSDKVFFWGGNKHRNCIFCEVDLENARIFLS